RLRRWQEQIENTFLDVELGLVGDLVYFLLASHLNCDFREIADHAFDVAAHVTDFREFRSLDFEKRGIRHAGQTAGNFGLADAGRSDHDYVLWNYVSCEIGSKLLATHTVAQSNCNCALCSILSDDVFVQFGNNLPRRQLVETQFRFFCFTCEVDNHLFFCLRLFQLSTANFLWFALELNLSSPVKHAG